MLIKVEGKEDSREVARNKLHPSRRKILDLIHGEETKDTFGWTPESEGTKVEETKRTSLLDQVKTPTFCPSCTKLMRRLDVTIWRRTGHCHDCQIDFEHKLRVKGLFPLWERKKVFENEISILKHDLEMLTDAYNSISPTSEFVSSQGYIQKFEFMGSIDEIKEDIKKNMDWITETLPAAESELERITTELNEKLDV